MRRIVAPWALGFGLAAVASTTSAFFPNTGWGNPMGNQMGNWGNPMGGFPGSGWSGPMGGMPWDSGWGGGNGGWGGGYDPMDWGY